MRSEAQVNTCVCKDMLGPSMLPYKKYACSLVRKPKFRPLALLGRSALAFMRGICPYEIIRIHHECEGGIEKSVPRITDWHHEACRVMTLGDREGRIFLSNPHTDNGFFFLLTTKYIILYWKNMKKTARKS